MFRFHIVPASEQCQPNNPSMYWHYLQVVSSIVYCMTILIWYQVNNAYTVLPQGLNQFLISTWHVPQNCFSVTKLRARLSSFPQPFQLSIRIHEAAGNIKQGAEGISKIHIHTAKSKHSDQSLAHCLDLA